MFFTVKTNFFDNHEPPQTSVSEYVEHTDTDNSADGETENGSEEKYEPPKFHISLIDVGVLLGVIAAYSIHKIREKRKQGRL
ncbi:MAG: hypothetical protein HDT43_00085 [Ruminococcaceae bacterium]|nr:hypothetical protein [Oscillospiraceae bacterium]